MLTTITFSQDYVLTYEWMNSFPTMSKGRRIILSSDSSIWRSDGQSWQHVGYADGTGLWNTASGGGAIDTNGLHYVKLAGKQPIGTYLVPQDTTNKWLPIGTALGGGSGFTYSKRTADTSNSAVALVNCGSMNFPVVSGTNYYFKFVITYSSAALTTGLRTTLTTPTFTNFSATVRHFGHAADGVGTPWAGTINTSGDVVVSTAVAVINANYTAVIEGRILPSANGTVWLQIGSEIATSAITIRNGSFVMVQSY